MSDCVINGRAINTLYPINGCLGAVLTPPEYEPIGCYYLITPECRAYYISEECKNYIIPSCGQDPFSTN